MGSTMPPDTAPREPVKDVVHVVIAKPAAPDHSHADSATDRNGA